MKKLLSISAVVLSASIAWHSVAFSAPTQTQESMSYCPDVSQIKKNPVRGNWTAQTTAGYWKSYHLSFATELTQFVGSEWVGENVGQIFCVYKSEQQFTMEGQLKTEETIPVILVFHTLTFQPNGAAWKASKKQGVLMCKSLKQADCPFTVRVKASVGDVFQEAESLKNQKSNTLQEPIY